VEQDHVLARLRERIFAFAASRLRREAAEDLTQDTLMLLHQKYAHVERLEELVPLAMRIVRFKAASMWRKAHRRGEDTAVQVDEQLLPDFAHNPGSAAERRELMDRMKTAFGKLGDRCRELFRLKLDGLPFPEIATRMGAASVNTVYTWDLRCRQRLRELIGDDWRLP
jgi:RNA polymerase sigma-70 factor (ECF subfamily)